MTAETTAVSFDAIDAALAAAAGNPGEDEQRLAVAVLRLLAAGARSASRPRPPRPGCPASGPSRCCGRGRRCSGTTMSG